MESIIHQAESTWPRLRAKNAPTREIVASTPPEFLPNVNKNGSSQWNLIFCPSKSALQAKNGTHSPVALSLGVTDMVSPSCPKMGLDSLDNFPGSFNF